MAFSVARQVSPAVSVRRMRGPNDTPIKPAGVRDLLLPATSRPGPISNVTPPARHASRSACASSGSDADARGESSSLAAVAGTLVSHDSVSHGRQRRQAITAALFAGGLDQCLPVRLALGGALAGKPDDGSGSLKWLDGGYTEFHCLLDQPVHLVAPGKPLGERDGERGFGFRGVVGAKRRTGVALADLGQRGRVAPPGR
jgi:hypothetical protein